MFQPAWRFRLLYVGIFGATGIQLPFWGIYLQSKGLSPAAIGWLLAIPWLIKLVNPAAGHWVDRRQDRKTPLRILSIIAFAAMLGFLFAERFPALLTLSLVVGAAQAAIIPLADNMTLLAGPRLGIDYGRTRLWGSMSFVAASFLMGQILALTGPSAIQVVTAALLLFCMLVTLRLLPDLPAEPAVETAIPAGPLLRDRNFLLFLGAASLIQASHAVYYTFSSIHWRGAGLSDRAIGLFWAEGVMAEVIFFALGSKILRRARPIQLIMAAGAAACLRWMVYAFTADPGLLALFQILHALSFAALHLGAMKFIHAQVPARLSARAQGVYTAIAAGIGPGTAMLVSGNLYQLMGGYAFLPMAVLAGFSLPLAWRLQRDAHETK